MSDTAAPLAWITPAALTAVRDSRAVQGFDSAIDWAIENSGDAGEWAACVADIGSRRMLPVIAPVARALDLITDDDMAAMLAAGLLRDRDGRPGSPGHEAAQRARKASR